MLLCRCDDVAPAVAAGDGNRVWLFKLWIGPATSELSTDIADIISSFVPFERSVNPDHAAGDDDIRSVDEFVFG